MGEIALADFEGKQVGWNDAEAGGACGLGWNVWQAVSRATKVEARRKRVRFMSASIV